MKNSILPSLVMLAAIALSMGADAQSFTTAHQIADLNPGANGSFPSNLVAFGNALYFSAYTLNTGRELWKYDGASITLATNINDTSDDIGFGVLEGNDSIPEWITPFEGSLYFSAFDPRRGGELWRYNGANAYRVADINPDPNDTVKFLQNSSWPRELTVVGTNLYFAADNLPQILNYELWRHNGATTVLVTNIHPNIGSNYSSYPSGLTAFGDSLFFMADDGVNGFELWKCTGARAVLLTNINPGGATSSSWPKSFAPFGNHLFFAAYDDTHGYELWKTDGTNTSLVADINPAGSSNPEFLTVFNGALYFRATDGTSGYELWKYDGLNVTRAADINPSGDSYPKNLTVFRDKLCFAADDGVHGWELWTFDGASAAMAADINEFGDSFPERLTVCSNMLYFSATNSAVGYEVWKYDGATVSLAADINPGSASSYPLFLDVYNSDLYFSANGSSTNSDWELWAIKSIPATTRITSIEVIGSNVKLVWSAFGGTTNVIQAASDVAGPYEDISAAIPVPGTGPTSIGFTNTAPFATTAARFYRVVTFAP